MPVGNAGLELVVAGDKVVVQVVSLPAQREMPGKTEVCAATEIPGKRCARAELACITGVFADMGSPDQEVPEGRNLGRFGQRDRNPRSEQEGVCLGAIVWDAATLGEGGKVLGEICREADPFS